MAKERSDAEGTYYTEIDPRNGKKRWCWKLRKGARGNQRPIVVKRSSNSERAKAIRVRIAELEASGLRVRPGQELTVEQHCNRWLEDFVKPRRSDGTYEKYRTHVAKHIVPAVGKLKVSSVGLATAEALLSHLQKATRPGPDETQVPLSDSTVADVMSVFCNAFNLSIRGLKKEGLDLPAGNAARDRVLDDDEEEDSEDIPGEGCNPSELTRFLDELLAIDELKTRPGESVQRYRDAHLIMFILNTGTRVSEALGVVIPVLNLRQGTVVVDKQLKWRKGRKGAREWYFGETKGKKARTVPLNGSAEQAIRQQLAMLEADRQRAGAVYEENALLFATRSGRPIHRRNVLRSVQTVASAAGIPAVTVHDLRRTFATYLADAEPRESVVGEILGHEKSETTRKHYIRARERSKRDAVALIDFRRPVAASN